MADERFDNEDLENLQPEDKSATDRIAEEAGQVTRELGERPIRDYVRQRTDGYRDQIRDNLDGIRKARREQSFKSAKELGQEAVDSAAEGLAGRGTGQAGTQAAKRVGKTGAQAGEATAATGASQAGAAVASQSAGSAAAGQVVAKGATQTGAKVVSSTGIKAIVGSVLNFAAPVIGFIVGWIIGELILKIPFVGKALEKIGEWGCKLIMLGCQILVIIVMVLIGIFIATVMGLASLGHWGSSPTKPIDSAKAEHRNQLELVWCLTTKDSTTLEEPPIKEDEANNEDSNKDAAQVKTAEIKDNGKESKNPQLTPECVAANAKMVDQGLKSMEKQLAYFENQKPKNLDALKQAYAELKEKGEAVKSAGADLQKARAGTEAFAAAHKKLQSEFAKISFDCGPLDLAAKGNDFGMIDLAQIRDAVNPPLRLSSTDGAERFVRPKMACWVIDLVVKIRALDPRLQNVSIGNTSWENGSGHGQSHSGGYTVDMHIPCVHPITPAVFTSNHPCPIDPRGNVDHQLAQRVADVINNMQPPPWQFIVGCNQSGYRLVGAPGRSFGDCIYRDGAWFLHDHHWHIIPDFGQ